MNFQLVTDFRKLRYNDDFAIRIAGPSSEIESFLDLNATERSRGRKPPFFLDSIDEENQVSPVEPLPMFLEDMDKLAQEIHNPGKPRGNQDQIADSEVWIPAGSDMFLSDVLEQLDLQADTSTTSATRGSKTRSHLKNEEVISLLSSSLRVQFESRIPNTNLTIPGKTIIPGTLHVLAFTIEGASFVDVKVEYIDQLQVFVGPTKPAAIVCNTNESALLKWGQSTAHDHYRCNLFDKPSNYCVVLFNPRPDRPCTYWLKGPYDLRGQI